MFALRLVKSGPSTPLVEQGGFKRQRGRPAAIRRPILITSLDAAMEFQEWCETVAVRRDKCLVHLGHALPRGMRLRLEIPNMKVQEFLLPSGRRICQWQSTPRSVIARVAGSTLVRGRTPYWVVELQFRSNRGGEPVSPAQQALGPVMA